jgi:hypothetical protein
MNLQRIFECENRGADALMRESDKRREVLIAFFERTPPSTQMRGIQTNLSNIDAAAFNARQRPDLFSCPLQEPSLYFGLQGFENWRLFLAWVFFLKARDLDFVQ